MKLNLPILLTLCCILLSVGIKFFCGSNPEYDFVALIAANFIMFVLSLAAWMMMKGTASERPQAFVRGVFGATMFRLFVCMIGILAYAVLNKAHLHKPSLFVMFGIYMLYTIIETLFVSRMAKKV